MVVIKRQLKPIAHSLIFLLMLVAGVAAGQSPPTLDTVFPAGGQAGQSVVVSVSGKFGPSGLTLRGSIPGLRCEALESERFRLTIPADALPGMYDLWITSDLGVSSPRTIYIGNRVEHLEAEPNDVLPMSMPVAGNVVINGRIQSSGDVDHFQFEAKQGQRIVIECWAERIDSRLRAVLEMFDAKGNRLAVNRGYFGIDPLIDFRVPTDGAYFVKVHDLVAGGGVEHYYRLDIDAGPRVAFCLPSVVEKDKDTAVRLYGWNLSGAAVESADASAPFDHIDVTIPGTLAQPAWPLPMRIRPAGAVFDGFAYHLPGSHASIAVGVSDIPVVLEQREHHTPSSAQLITVPCEVSGQFLEKGERDWYAIEARRGEVLYIEGMAQRLSSPIDLDISVLDETGSREMARFSDEIRNIGSSDFPTNHLDPVGRWVAPANGRFLIAVRNLSGETDSDPRRVYRLSVRREEPIFQLLAVPHSAGSNGIHVRRGGRERIDLVALRQRGCDGPIRIVARDLPPGVECPEVCLGPGTDRVAVVVTADANAPNWTGELVLEGIMEEAGREKQDSAGSTSAGPTTNENVLVRNANRPLARAGTAVRAGTVVRPGTPNGWGRLTSRLPLAVAGDSSLRISANGHEPLEHQLYGKLQVRHSPGGMLDVAVEVERRSTDHSAPVKLLGTGLPDLLNNQTAVIPAGEKKGYLSFYLPPTLPVGRYSLVIQAETTIPKSEKGTETQSVTVFSNPVTFDVHPAAFLVEAEPFAPKRARRGETLQIRYSAQRRNGFIGKMHTELAVPGRVTDVPGLRGRGETFVGQTDTGALQVVVNDDAPLGSPPFLRLFTVGVVEDQPVYFGSSPLTLEIVE